MIPTKQPNGIVVSEELVPDTTIIWRYMKFKRFVRILKTHKVWFARPFKFEDQWEGLFPPSYLRRTRQYADANGISFEEFDREFQKRHLRHKYAHFVNCWHMSDHESDAMWKLYALPPCGIAVQSTVGDVTNESTNCWTVMLSEAKHLVQSTARFLAALGMTTSNIFRSG